MKRAAPALAWAAFLLTLLAAIGWGAHAPSSWDVDNIAPGSVLRALAARFGPDWYSSYGPVPYVLVGLIYLPLLLIFRIAGELGAPVAEYPWGFAHPDFSIGTLIVAARLVCVALACGVAFVTTRERWTAGGRDVWLPPLLLAGSPAFVYYARTSNVDLFYLFFLALAFGLERRAAGEWMRAAVGAAAALAICCKEQAAPLAVVAALAAAWSGFRAAPTATARIRAVAVVALAGVAAYAIAWALPFHLAGWRAHHQFIFEQARYPREFPATPAGMLGLTGRAVLMLPVTVGWPMIAGMAVAMFRRDAWRGLASRLLALCLYAGGFLAVIGYVYPRFLLPAMLLMLPLAIRGWSIVFDGARRREAMVLVALVAGTMLGGPLLDLAQIRDTRYRAAEWLEARRPAALARGTPPTLEGVGNPRFQMRVPPGFITRWTVADSLRRTPRSPDADVVLMSSFDAYEVHSDSLLNEVWWKPLHDPAGAYRLAADLAPPRWTRPVAGLPISPVIWIWVRRDGPFGP